MLARAASELGVKAQSLRLDILEEDRLASVAADHDVVVNVAGPEEEVLLPALRAAIKAGTDSCDIGGIGWVAERQLELDAAAQARGVSAIIGIGYCPGIDNLLAVHAARQLDEVEEVQLQHRWLDARYLAEVLEPFRRNGTVDTSLIAVFRYLGRRIRTYRNGTWTEVNPLEEAADVLTPGHGPDLAYPFATSEGVTLPRFLTDVRTVWVAFILPPPPLRELILSEAGEVADGLAPAEAAKSVLETLAADPTRWLLPPTAAPGVPAPSQSVAAIGSKAGRPARLTCWPERVPESTTIPLVVAALRLLRGEIGRRGVLPPEAAFEPMSFLEEAATYAEGEGRDKPLLGERLDWLE